MEVRGITKPHVSAKSQTTDSFVNFLSMPDKEVFEFAKLLSKYPRYAWVEVWSNGERIKVYVKGHVVLSA